MRKLLSIVAACIVGIIMVTSCGGTPATVTSPEVPTTPQQETETPIPEIEEPAPTPTPPLTFESIVITGSGEKTSPPFTVTTEEWIIDWSYVPDSDYPEFSIFSFFVYPRGETVLYVESVLFSEATSGSTYSYAGPGDYYIEVVAANVKSWEVVVSPA